MRPSLVTVLALLTESVWAAEPITVYWNISNPIFSGGFGADYKNVIEVNKDTHPWEYDQVGL